MLREDYLVRMITQLIQALQYAAGLSKDHQFADAISANKDAVQKLFALNDDILDQLSGNELVELVKMGEPDSVWPKKCRALAALLAQQGDLYQHLAEPDRHYQRSLQALQLLLAMRNGGAVGSTTEIAVTEIDPIGTEALQALAEAD